MATKKNNTINEYKDRFNSPIGIKDLVLPKKGKKKGKSK